MDSITAGIETRKEITAALEKFNLGLDRGLTKLNELLDAQRQILGVKGKEADGGSLEFVDVPDNQTQIKALDMLFKLGDFYPSQKIDANLKHTGNVASIMVKYLTEKKQEKVKVKNGRK